MIKRSCMHYRWVGDYGMNLCRKDGLKGERTEFNCKNCPDFRTHTSGLAKCPFCGGKAYLGSTYEYRDEWEICCQKCHATMRKCGIKNVIEAWNNRKTP